MAKGKVSIRYKRGDSFRVISVTGAAGGLTPTGEIYCNLYVEYPELPDTTDIDIEESGKLSKTVAEFSVETFTREINAALVLTSSGARALGKWLMEWADRSDKRFVTDNVKKTAH